MTTKIALNLITYICQQYNLPMSVNQSCVTITIPIGITQEKTKENVHEEIISHLNELTGSKYKSTSKSTQKLINGRLSEGYTVEDFKSVIGVKIKEWKGTSFEQYLRPSTLFAPSKFEEYLNQKEEAPKKTLIDLLKDEWDG